MRNLILMIIAYLLGSFPSALVIGKTFYNKDIRNYGSGNLGSTNAFRVLGKKGGCNDFSFNHRRFCPNWSHLSHLR